MNGKEVAEDDDLYEDFIGRKDMTLSNIISKSKKRRVDTVTK